MRQEIQTDVTSAPALFFDLFFEAPTVSFPAGVYEQQTAIGSETIRGSLMEMENDARDGAPTITYVEDAEVWYRPRGQLMNGTLIDWGAYGTAVDSLYRTGGGESFPQQLAALNQRFGLRGEPVEPVEQRASTCGGSLTVGFIGAVNALAGGGGGQGGGGDSSVAYQSGESRRRRVSPFVRAAKAFVVASLLFGACQRAAAPQGNPNDAPPPPGITQEAPSHLLSSSDEGLELQAWLGAHSVVDNCVIQDAAEHDAFADSGGTAIIEGLAGVANEALAQAPPDIVDDLSTLACSVTAEGDVAMYFTTDTTPQDRIVRVPTLAGVLVPGVIGQEGHISVIINDAPESTAVETTDVSAVVDLTDCATVLQKDDVLGTMDEKVRQATHDALFADEWRSITDSLQTQGIDPSQVDLESLCWVDRGENPPDGRIAVLVFSNDHTSAWVTQLPDGSFPHRPDLRVGDFHWVQIDAPEGLGLEGVFPQGEEVPQILAVDPAQDTKAGTPVIARWQQGTWFTPDGRVFVSPTATPPPTETPEPTATPAETGPESCMDTTYIETHFVQPYLEQSGFADMPTAMTKFREVNGKGGSAWSHDPSVNYTEHISFSPVMYLGNYKVSFAIPGYSGTARCVVVAYPGTGDSVRVITVVTDAIANGQWSMRGVFQADGLGNKDIQEEADIDAWLNKRNPGDPVRILISAGSGPSIRDSVYDMPKYSRIRDLILATYPGRFEKDNALMEEVAGDLIVPDVFRMFQSLDQSEDVGLIAGIGDPLNK